MRDKQIIRTAIIGIIANVLLAGFKAVVGMLAGSVAIILDAVNNISDAASSMITIIGTKLAGKQPDKSHPFGYGRVEYMSALVISLIVLYAGVTALTESVKKILDPQLPSYSAVTLVIVAAGVLVKIILGRYVKAQGVKLKSDSLVNSGEDASMDALISAATLVAALLYMFAGISLEAWLGAAISLFIIYSGIGMIRETISRLLGERADFSLVKAIKKTVTEFDGVSGAYDLVLNNYGPDAYNGSVHIEVPDTYSANDLDHLLREIQVKVFQEHNVILTAIGVYSINTKDEEAIRMREDIRSMVMEQPYVLQMHGFYLEKPEKKIRFDVVVSFDAPDRRAVEKELENKLKTSYPEYDFTIALDIDFSETE